MIIYQWAIIDPGFDRPFFSSSPPPATLVQTPGMSVIQYAVEAPDPPMVTTAIPAGSIACARQDAFERFALAQKLAKTR